MEEGRAFSTTPTLCRAWSRPSRTLSAPPSTRPTLSVRRLQKEGFSALGAADSWSRLSPEDRNELTAQHQLDHLPTIKVGTTDEVLATLGESKLQEWATLRDAIPSRFAQALAAAAKLLEPKAQQVKLPSRTIKSESDLKAWLASVEATIRARLTEGPVIV